MRTLTEKPKATARPAAAKSSPLERLHQLNHPQHTMANPAPQPLTDVHGRLGERNSRYMGSAHLAQDFSHTPPRATPSPPSQASHMVGSENHLGERVPSFGAIPAKVSLRPHEGSPETFRREAAIYAQGKTPVRVQGHVAAWDAKPLGASETGAHLSEIRRQFGSDGMERSVHGLAHTRGKAFAQDAAAHAGFSMVPNSSKGGAIGQQAAGAIRASNASNALPENVREKLTVESGHDFSGIAIHNDTGAHRAADLLNARAFTVGRSIYFARNEYQPTTTAGMHLLAHEAAHTVQQRGRESEPGEHLHVTDSADREENEASHFADFIATPGTAAAPPLTPSTRTGLLHRAISFTHANDAFTTNNVAANENAAGFRLSSATTPSFQWDTDVTIHGVAGDPFGHFQVGFLQVERVFGANVYWGSGANQTHRAVRPDGPLPRRDAASAGSIFASDSAPYVRPAFTANGDVRSPSFNDTPGTQRFPWANPIGGRVSNSGWFNYGDAFVTYLSARDTTAGTGAAAFRHIANVYWNLSAAGRFDTTQAIGSRVSLTTPGAVNHSHVIEGASGEFPAMHGGTIANGHDTTTDT